jgi:hypothetical protein
MLSTNEAKPTLVVEFGGHSRAAGEALTLSIASAAGEALRKLEVPGGAGIHRIVWNLRNEKDKLVEPGEYTVTVRRSAGGNADAFS